MVRQLSSFLHIETDAELCLELSPFISSFILFQPTPSIPSPSSLRPSKVALGASGTLVTLPSNVQLFSEYDELYFGSMEEEQKEGEEGGEHDNKEERKKDK